MCLDLTNHYKADMTITKKTNLLINFLIVLALFLAPWAALYIAYTQIGFFELLKKIVWAVILISLFIHLIDRIREYN